METANSTQRIEAWSQLLIVVLAMLGSLWYLSARLSAIEQWEVSAENDRAEMQNAINRMETRLDAVVDARGGVHGNR
jgi:hypothetical protein